MASDFSHDRRRAVTPRYRQKKILQSATGDDELLADGRFPVRGIETGGRATLAGPVHSS
ncbi:MAG: hypothetical protein ABEI52_10685 [Halobacteriaceae archaeon]